MVKPLYQKDREVLNFHLSLQYDETVKEETKMVIQALGIILVLAVVMSVAAVGSSTSGRTDP